jgi:hypothetical protein
LKNIFNNNDIDADFFKKAKSINPSLPGKELFYLKYNTLKHPPVLPWMINYKDKKLSLIDVRHVEYFLC